MTCRGSDLRDVEVYIIAHQHWDPAWAFQRRHILPLLPKFFDELIGRLREHPSYKFVLDGQTHIVREYLRQLAPEEAEERKRELSKYVREGRLCVGPFYSQIDWNLTDGETWIRNLLIGFKDAMELGRVMKVGWLVDIFGFPDATPRVLRGFGIDSVFLSRGIGVRREEVRDVYKWVSSSGDEVYAFHLLESYRNAIRLSKYAEIAWDRVLGEVKALIRYSATGKTVLLLDGYENLPEADDVVPVIEDLNRRGVLKGVFLCTPEEYVGVIKKYAPPLTSIRGYLHHGKYATALRGVFSSRVKIKQKFMECERKLIWHVDPLACFTWLLGGDHPRKVIEELWRRLLECAFHDEICGCHIDDVSKDLEDALNRIETHCHELTEGYLKALARSIDTSWVKDGIALLVYNPSPWRRKGVLKVILELPRGFEEFLLREANGRELPVQTGWRSDRRVEVWFEAEIPPLGYKVFGIFPGKPRRYQPRLKLFERGVENEWVKVWVNSDGTLTLQDKVTGRVYERLAYLKSEGEAGDLYTSYCLTEQVYTSLGAEAEVEPIIKGPLAARLRVRYRLRLPEGLTRDRAGRRSKLRDYPVIMYVEVRAGSPRVDIRVELNNSVKDHRLRICFPTKIDSDKIVCQQQFDIAVFPIRPDSTGYSNKETCPLEGVVPPQWDTRPADGNVHHGFVDVHDEDAGLALISRDVYEYWVGPPGNTLMLTLIRGVGWLGVDIPIRAGRAGWEIRTPLAQCLGRHTFEISVVPHKGDWFDACLHVVARNRRLDLLVAQTDAHQGVLPPEMSFLELVSEPEGALEVTAVKVGEDGESLCVRVCNYTEEDAEAVIKTPFRVTEAYLCDLAENPLERLSASKNGIRFKIGGKRIATVKLKVERRRALKLGGSAKVVSQQMPVPVKDEKWLNTDIPPVITEEELKEDVANAERFKEDFEIAQAEFREAVERGLYLSPKLSERRGFWEARLRMIRAIERMKDAEYSALLDEKRLIELKSLDEEKLRRVQQRIDDLVKGLMDPRAESQVAIHAINNYRLLAEDC